METFAITFLGTQLLIWLSLRIIKKISDYYDFDEVADWIEQWELLIIVIFLIIDILTIPILIKI